MFPCMCFVLVVQQYYVRQLEFTIWIYTIHTPPLHTHAHTHVDIFTSRCLDGVLCRSLWLSPSCLVCEGSSTRHWGWRTHESHSTTKPVSLPPSTFTQYAPYCLCVWMCVHVHMLVNLHGYDYTLQNSYTFMHFCLYVSPHMSGIIVEQFVRIGGLGSVCACIAG